jgi:large subunit ribosomal protein L30
VPNKTGTIHIKWVRSGIGFSRKQREVVRSMGLRRLNHVVERPDTAHFRGLVAKVSHLVEVVSSSAAPAWTGVPEYKIIPSETAHGKATPAAKKTKASEEAPGEAPIATKEVVAKEKEKAVAPAKKTAAAKSREAKPSDKKASAGSEKLKAKRKPVAAKPAASAKKESKPKKGKK